ncbi:MAG: RNA polymerase factor sigma-32 [Bdellovibrionaceae bacterium]|nr:RNA polymerase factor sigma-32 [Pseudobdellovibrionaceae bacterium]
MATKGKGTGKGPKKSADRTTRKQPRSDTVRPKAPAKRQLSASSKNAKTKSARSPHDPALTSETEDSPRLVTAEIIDASPLEDSTSPHVDDSEAYTGSEPTNLISDDDDEVLAPQKSKPAARKKLPVPVTQETGTTSDDPVTTYLAEIRKYPLLTKEQEYDLAVRFREHKDPNAAEQLVTANLRFVVKIATEYSRFGAKLIDLIQEGNVGLMHAVREFNPYKGVRLITYAVWWIRGYIQEYLMRQYSMVRIGTTQNQRKLFYRLQKEKMRLDSMGQEPTVPLLSSRLGVSEDEVRLMSQRLSGRDISLNQPLDVESPSSLLDFAASDDMSVDEKIGNAEQLAVLRENIEKIRPHLNEKELYILENRVLADEPMTLQEIGEHYGVTREAVRQIEARLINRIRLAFTESLDAPALTNTRQRGDADNL